MSIIRINTHNVRENRAKTRKNILKIQDVKYELSRLSSNVDCRLRSRRDIDGRLTEVCSSLDHLESKLQVLSSFISYATEQYNLAENRISDLEHRFLGLNKKSSGGLEALFRNLWEEGIDFTEAAWDFTLGAWQKVGGTTDITMYRTTDFLSDLWDNTNDYLEIAWDHTTEVIYDTYENAKNLTGTAWKLTTKYIQDAWDEISEEVIEPAWKGITKWFDDVDWTYVLENTLTVIDGFSELGLAKTVATASGATAIFTEGGATPVAIVGLAGSVYLFADGANKFVSGTFNVLDEIIMPNKNNLPDVDNYVLKVHESLLGEDWSKTVYTIEQVVISAGSIGTALNNMYKLANKGIEIGVPDMVETFIKNKYDQFMIGKTTYDYGTNDKEEKKEDQR